MSFGRKGLPREATASAGGAAGLGAARTGFGTQRASGAQPVPQPASRRDSAHDTDMTPDEIAAKREAFIAAERARNGGQGNAQPATPMHEVTLNTPASTKQPAEARAHQSRPEPRGREKKFIFGPPQGRTLAIAYAFWFIAGTGSLHRFYCGQSASAFMQIGLLIVSVIVGGFFPPLGTIGIVAWLIWVVADVFLISGMMRRFKAEHAFPDTSIFD